jgi:tetratricopeptide (TPR) repeat protein
MALEMQGKHDEAIKHFGIVLNLDPNYPDAQRKMIASMIAADRTEDAISQLNEMTKTSNNPSAVYANIGALYEKEGNHSLAVKSWTRSLELNPDNIGALNDLAWVLATADNASVMDAPRALKLAQHACELTGYKEPALLDTLGAAYAATGKFDEAIQKAEQAIEAAKARKQENLASKIESRLQLYRANQRYRQK